MALGKTEPLENWIPRTSLRRKMKKRENTSIYEILDKGLKILEPEIIDTLITNLEHSLLEIGQSKGKFGGGRGSIWKQTQKITKEGANITFTSYVVVGNKDGYIGIGSGSAKETVPAREKAIRQAKLNMIKIRRGCGAWAAGSRTPSSIPFETIGKCGSIVVTLKPAPLGTKLVAEKKCRKILELAGIKDVYAKTRGKTPTRINMVKACFDALNNLNKMYVSEKQAKELCLVEGSLKNV